MFELSVACKYLLPRWRQLSVSIISIVSTLVIALVVWLIVVFFSVKEGLENSWIDKIVTLTAPVRITPTEKYYKSYYSLIDTISSSSNYTQKSLGEKLVSAQADPYAPDIDEEIPSNWPLPDRDQEGQVKDLVQLAYEAAASLKGLKNLKISDYETTFANMRLRLVRHAQDHPSQQFIEHAAYVGSFNADTSSAAQLLIAPSPADFNNLLHMQSISSDNIHEESPAVVHTLDVAEMQEGFKQFFSTIHIRSLKTPPAGWRLPIHLLPQTAIFKAAALTKGGQVLKFILPPTVDQMDALINDHLFNGFHVFAADLLIENGQIKVAGVSQASIAPKASIWLPGGVSLPAEIVEESLENARKPGNIKFHVLAEMQGVPVKGDVALDTLEIDQAKIRKNAPISLFAQADGQALALPGSSQAGDPILLPRNFRESGVLIGDQGYLSYYSPTPSTVQEQRIPIFVAGFYDPGIMPIGGKYLLADKELAALIRTSYSQDSQPINNGFNIHFSNRNEAPRVKAELLAALSQRGIAPYWRVETYQEYEFSKDLIQQLHSEKNLFSLISLIIIIVACSNIISMLIILVNDKKLEIGILRSMGASSGSIALIFGLCGMVMGAFGSLIGICAAVATLRHVNALVGFISSIQGHDLFNPVFYGNTLPTDLSIEALTFVILTTAFISLLAGVVPAVKASMLRPSAILRAE